MVAPTTATATAKSVVRGFSTADFQEWMESWDKLRREARMSLGRRESEFWIGSFDQRFKVNFQERMEARN